MGTNSDMEQIFILVSGQVQGVYFRAATKHIADRLDLGGYAKNLADGRVEVLAVGSKADLEKLAKFCGQGPAAARVTNIEISWQPPTYKQRAFLVL